MTRDDIRARLASHRGGAGVTGQVVVEALRAARELLVVEALRAARELLSEPARWTQGAGARSAKGNPVNPHGRAAVSWCASGALRKVRGDSEAYFLLEETVSDTDPLPRWNDEPTRTHAEVLAAFDAAIARATS